MDVFTKMGVGHVTQGPYMVPFLLSMHNLYSKIFQCSPDISEAASAVSGTIGEGRSTSAGFSRASRSTVGATGIAVVAESPETDGFLGPLKCNNIV